MKEISQSELKKLLIDMLQDIHNFCEKNNINIDEKNIDSIENDLYIDKNSI